MIENNPSITTLKDSLEDLDNESFEGHGIMEALLEAKKELGLVERVGTNPHFKNKYATLATLHTHINEVYFKHDLMIIITPIYNGEKLVLTGKTIHVPSKQYIYNGEYPIESPKSNDPQALGSAKTYAERQFLTLIAGVATEDDDAEKARMEREKQEKKISSRQEVVIMDEAYKIALYDHIEEDKANEYIARLKQAIEVGKINKDNYDKALNKVMDDVQEQEDIQRSFDSGMEIE